MFRFWSFVTMFRRDNFLHEIRPFWVESRLWAIWQYWHEISLFGQILWCCWQLDFVRILPQPFGHGACLGIQISGWFTTKLRYCSSWWLYGQFALTHCTSKILRNSWARFDQSLIFRGSLHCGQLWSRFLLFRYCRAQGPQNAADSQFWHSFAL